MSIDWITVGGQALNFVILIWLMKRFLYKPILSAIDEREKKIALQISDATTQKSEAQKLSESLKKKNEDIDQQRAELLKKARADAEALKENMLSEARKTADNLRNKRQEALQNEQKILYKELGRLAQNEVFAIARKALSDLAGVELEEKIVEVFIRKLNDMTVIAKADFTAALNSSSSPLSIISSFELSTTQRSNIETAIKVNLKDSKTFKYKTSPETLAGIELSTNGQRVAWSLNDYISSMQKTFEDQLKTSESADQSQSSLKVPLEPKSEELQL